MAKSKSLPAHVVRITEYEDLERYARAFAGGHLNLLIVCGPPGLGKSQCIRGAVGGAACWVDGNATAFGIYLSAYEFRDQPVVLDDVDGVYRDKNGVRLLKALCQTDRMKAVSWQSDSKTLERKGIPKRFITSSRVTIIANQWRSVDADVAALEDRGHFLLFDPSPLAVHRRAAEWFGDQEIFDFIGANLLLTSQHSLRTYVLAAELKGAGLDWRGGVLSRWLTGTKLAVARLKFDPTFATEEERVRFFVNAGGGCRATYFNHARTLVPAAAVSPIKLTRSTPPAPSPPIELSVSRSGSEASESESVRLLDGGAEAGESQSISAAAITTSPGQY